MPRPPRCPRSRQPLLSNPQHILVKELPLQLEDKISAGSEWRACTCPTQRQMSAAGEWRAFAWAQRQFTAGKGLGNATGSEGDPERHRGVRGSVSQSEVRGARKAREERKTRTVHQPCGDACRCMQAGRGTTDPCHAEQGHDRLHPWRAALLRCLSALLKLSTSPAPVLHNLPSVGLSANFSNSS
ncbi:hypothetical protein CC80DRAFT_85767 [Byssothecium circinans]|uniref:Uncharacterized protein n=1 Tax=Byssothecium circinans TaxID=147558 RepID=A0A6A5TSV6_9PLEO|nr:hypothetical protein CC80DRAFT_85767 [Byssothecium circinans]